MKTRLSILLWFLIAQVLLSACTRAGVEELVNLDDEYTNQQIKLLVPTQFNSSKTTSSVVLEVQYYSTYDIVFPNNYNVRIFKQTSNGWIEIEEKPTLRLPKDDIVFSSEQGTTAIRLFTVDPELVDYTQIYKLRFYIFGNMKVEDGIKQVAAFVDVELSP